MTADRDDPILDACLDEVLGGRTAPDLTARILQAWAARGHAVEPGEPEPPPIVAANGRPLVELRTGPATELRANKTSWQPLLVAASLLAVGLAIGVTAVVLSNRQEIAEHQPPAPQPGDSAVANVDPAPADPNVRPESPPAAAELRDSRPLVIERPPGSGNPPQIAASDFPPSTESPTPHVPEKRYLDPSPDTEVVSFVNAELARSWTEAGITAAPDATDAEWCRRLFVRVLGRIPTVEELNRFKSDKSADKREELVDRLLSEEAYVLEYAHHWAVNWTNVLIGRTGGQGDSPASREGLEQYLRTALARNKPYDEIVRDLLTATGSAEPGTEGYNGAVNFLLDGLGKDATVATSRVARVFLGSQLQCAQCHTHPTQEWQQQDFWALNAFFRQMKLEREGDATNLVNADFSGQGRNSTDGEVYYETPHGLLKTAFPRFIDGTDLPTSGNLADVDRRAELAKLVVNSKQLPRAMVNRLWSHFFGYGFTRPVDDLGPNTTPSHPELLERLALEFEAHDYDLKSAIRWIALSDAFARSSRMSDLASKDMPEAGEVALFSRYYSRQMQAEEVYNSLVQAAQIRKTAANEADLAKARASWLAQFSRNMATDDAQEESHFAGGVRQSLIMMNGDLMRQAVSSQHAGLLKTVAASDMKFDKKVGHVFLSALSRDPTRRELAVAETILKNVRGDESAALEDILWAILNSNEFILDH